MKKEIRSIGEIRAIEDEDEGIVTAYLTKWGTVDSYNSTFQRGAFKQSFENRQEKGRIKFMYNHDTLIGKVLSAKEDGTGPKVRAQFNLDTQAGKDAFAHVKSGDLDGFSFGFFVNRDKMKDGVRVIQDVDCLECGPVIFPANQDASIVDVREQDLDEPEIEVEDRATDFNETAARLEMSSRRWRILDSLVITLEDIMWDMDNAEWESASNVAINDFQSAYIGWVGEYVEMMEAQNMRSIPMDSPLKAAFRELLDGKTVADFAADTELTRSECETLRAGRFLDEKSERKLKAFEDFHAVYQEETLRAGRFLDEKSERKLKAFEDFHAVYQEQRSKHFEQMFQGIKSAIRPDERKKLLDELRREDQENEFLLFRKRIQALTNNLT